MKYSQSVCALNLYSSLNIIDELVASGMKFIHIDFMDSFYVENFGFSYEMAEFLINRYPEINFDAHLMVKKPLRLIEKLQNIGFKTIFLPANEINQNDFINTSKNYPNLSFGIMLEAKNNPQDYKNLIINSKKILLMTINKIGGTGVQLDQKLFEKVKEIKNINQHITIYSDGGLRVNNSDLFYNNEIDIAVGGSIIFSFENPKSFYKWWKEKYDS
ncbi:ribulose phosphate epimerase [Mesomycoplasma lagogenitalium]|uniref:Ribulose phosphate epimerase n=1 Tax=Mesomycoplasma lagogenitalium TaxID=171286 RepID=A0ABY8LVZ2_9BACT|nr:ribulose phosphate epimerase [Mesomycoplasma lagogenitalium]WGI36975.1 ribulose phosphate epimerase [Mesomycoplasma lagogenitalium]